MSGAVGVGRRARRRRRVLLGVKPGPLNVCMMCGAVAVLPLTDELRRRQPDDTTHVCHPGLGGCNHGFADEDTLAAERRVVEVVEVKAGGRDKCPGWSL